MSVAGRRAFAAVVWLAAAWLAEAQPTGVHFTVRTRGGQSTFRIGEEIPLELSYSADSPQRYQLDVANFDPTGRLRLETFAVQPRTGWSDPLDLYMRSMSFPGGAYSAIQPFPAQPFVLGVDLNEWVRFDQPGDYRVTAQSRRLRGQLLMSNELALTIVAAAPEWQQQTFTKALADINDPPTRVAAEKTLRFLGTEAAAREMARRTQDQDCRLGVAGSVYRAAAHEEMHKLLRDPSTSIDRPFLDLYAFLTMPDRPGDRNQAYNDGSNRAQQELLEALSQKMGVALTTSARTILENPRGVLPDVRQSLTDILLANFDSLPIMEQANLLRSPANVLERPLLAGLLRKVALRYQEFPQPQSVEAMNFNRICGDALMQWYELDAVNARDVIVREIERPNPRFGLDVLGILPDRELPQVEPTLLEHFRKASDRFAARNLAALIARYAGKAGEAELTARLDREASAGLCDLQAPLLAWLLRVDPAQAEQRLQNPGMCPASLSEIGRLQPSPVLTAMAVRALDTPGGGTAADGAAYLTDNGTPEVEEALWSHYAAWSKRWNDHEAELNASPADMRTGQALFQALVMGNAWLMTDSKLRRLADLAIGNGLRQQAEQYRRIWQNQPWLIRAAGYEQYQIGWYHANSMVAAKRKLAQFPQGTEMRWIMQGLPSDSADFKELAQFGAERGIRIW